MSSRGIADTSPRDSSPTDSASPSDSYPASPEPRATRVALLGNPNTGKTTLFNRLCGTRAKTANYTGITVDARIGRMRVGDQPIEVTDLPGCYGLDLESPESDLCRAVLEGNLARHSMPDGAVVVVEATNLERNLVLALEVLALELPTIIVVNMMDLARKQGLDVDFDRLSSELGCPVVGFNARTGEGTEKLFTALRDIATGELRPNLEHPWQSPVASAAALATASCQYDEELHQKHTQFTDKLDNFFTHRVWGTLTFLAVMTGLFYTIFSIASYPMEWIDASFAFAGEHLAEWITNDTARSFVVDGVVGGLAGTLVFLPQICLLFFLLSLLEDTGYLARAAFLIDGVMRRFGLPGQAFVPLLTSHACALPGIMSARLIPEWRDRLATILVAPFMSCSARLPVYTLLVGILFGDQPLYAALAFLGCYALGAIVALLTAGLLRKTLLPGRSSALMLELPTYKAPSLRSAVTTTIDRAGIFVRKAGTVILLICIALWALQSYPKPSAVELVPAILAYDAAEELETNYLPQAPTEAERTRIQARIDEELALGERLENQITLEQSIAGRLGQRLEPIFEPIGADWRLTIAILTSFAAREVFGSTLRVTLGMEAEAEEGVLETIRTAERDDGSLLFTPAVAASLLVFYVLAMQCLPTLAVTRREAGGWRWSFFQLAYMSLVAYGAAFITFQLAKLWS